MSDSSRDWFNQRKEKGAQMRILVTGARGFIGGYVVRELLRQGMEPVPFDVPLCDIRDAEVVDAAVAETDGWIHLAGVLGTKETVDRPATALRTNIFGMLNVLEAARKHGRPGANIAVGNHWMNNPYSISKSTAERLCLMFNKEHGTRVNTVRTVNAYGPGQEPPPPFGRAPYAKIVPTFACSAISHVPIRLYGAGLQTSDVCFVEDVARSLVFGLLEAAAGRVWPRACAFGPREHLQVREVAAIIASEAQVLGFGEADFELLPMRAGEEEGSRVTAPSEDLLMFGSLVDAALPSEEGLRRTVRWYAEQANVSWKVPAREGAA